LKLKFIALDKDEDDKLSFEEVKEFLQRRHIGHGIEKLKTRFKTADKNDDGFLNYHEFLAMERSSEDGKDSSCEDDRSTEARRASDPVLPQSARRLSRGPERFFYDHSTYTGVPGHCVIVPAEPRKHDTKVFRRRHGHAPANAFLERILDNFVPDTSS